MARTASAQVGGVIRGGRPGLGSTLRIPGYGWMWAAGALWHTSRWGMAFLAAYVARTRSESPDSSS